MTIEIKNDRSRTRTVIYDLKVERTVLKYGRETAKKIKIKLRVSVSASSRTTLGELNKKGGRVAREHLQSLRLCGQYHEHIHLPSVESHLSQSQFQCHPARRQQPTFNQRRDRLGITEFINDKKGR